MKKIILNPLNLAEEIINRKIKVFFISPHLDDAIFSAGGLIAHLAKKVPLTVVNVFTSSGNGISTLSAAKYLRQCQTRDPKRLFEIRLKEDRTVFSKLDAKVVNLGLTDALWRKKKRLGIVRSVLSRILPEFGALYPTYRFHILGKINKEDGILQTKIRQRLKSIIQKEKDNFLVFCPLGFGSHVDHLIVRDICTNLFKDNLIYWSDSPYFMESKKKPWDYSVSLKKQNFIKFIYKIPDSTKRHLCGIYKSQINRVFKDKAAFYKQESYYLADLRKDNLSTEVSYTIDDKLLKDWNNLWQNSSLRHYFNSPTWFLACQRTFNYGKSVFIKCYRNVRLVGILPLIFTKKYAIASYNFAGNQYLDKASILLINNDTNILKSLINCLSQLGNYYLAEIEESLLNIHNLKQEIGFASSSVSPFLPLSQNPFQHLSVTNKKKIVKKIEAEQKQFALKIFRGNVEQSLRAMGEIESATFNSKQNRDAFSDIRLRQLYLNLGRLDGDSVTVFILLYKGEPICFRAGFIAGNTYFGSHTAYKTIYKHLIPGKILIFLMLPELAKMGIEVVDFSRGNNPLKRDLTPYSNEQYSIFYSANLLVMVWWKSLVSLKNVLEVHQTLFRFIQQGKRIITKQPIG